MSQETIEWLQEQVDKQVDHFNWFNKDHSTAKSALEYLKNYKDMKDYRTEKTKRK